MSTLSNYTIPSDVLIITSESSTGGCVIDPKSPRSIAAARKRFESSIYDSFTHTSIMQYGKENLIKNSGLRVKITPKHQRSDRNTSIETVICNVMTEDTVVSVPLELGRILNILATTDVKDGVIQSDIRIGLSNGIAYPILESEYLEMVGTEGNKSKGPGLTTKYEIGTLYATPKGTSTEIYLGELYSHIEIKSFRNLIWHDKPKKVYVMFEPRYSGGLSTYDHSIDNKSVDDILNELYSAKYNRYAATSIKDAPFAIAVMCNSIKASKVGRIKTNKVFPYNGTITIASALTEARKWVENELPKNNTSYISTEITRVLGLYSTCEERKLDEAALDKLLNMLYKHYTLEYNGNEYSGKHS